MMTNFTVHTRKTAPENSKPILENVEQAYGFLPNLMGVFSESPAALEAYAALTGIFDKSDFTTIERQVILMTNNRLNACTYCMAAHTTISGMQKVPQDIVEALRLGTSLADAKLEALRKFAVTINKNRGLVQSKDIDAFLSAGYSKANILEVILGTGLKVLSNYTNHIAKTPLDDVLKVNEWSADHSSAA